MADLDRRLKRTFSEIQNPKEPGDRAVNLRNGIGKAQRLFRKARWLTLKTSLRSIFSGRGNELIQLGGILDQQSVESWNYLGIHELCIRLIIGTEEKASEFDGQFNPRPDLNRERWLDIATAAFAGISFPPVELIQLPMGYFVQSGHYRISVLRALGENTIKAYVTNLHILATRIPLNSSTS